MTALGPLPLTYLVLTVGLEILEISFRESFEGIRNPEKGALAKGALRRFVANCVPNLRKNCRYFVSYIRASVRKIVANLKANFGQSYANTPFPKPPFSEFLRGFCDAEIHGKRGL